MLVSSQMVPLHWNVAIRNLDQRVSASVLLTWEKLASLFPSQKDRVSVYEAVVTEAFTLHN